MQNLKPTVKWKLAAFLRRKNRVNAIIKSQHPDFRVVINRSNRYIKAQLLDKTGKVLGYVCDKDLSWENKSQKAHQAWLALAKVIQDKKIEKVIFDRNGYLYHGRIQSFVEGLRAGWVTI
jgi:large subunit ribosomal protein L18